MSRIQTITLTGNGASPQNSSPVPLNFRLNPFQVGLGAATDGSTTTATVQVCFDDPTDLSSATWFNHDSLVTIAANATGNIAFPVTGIRLQVSAAGTDTWTLYIVQARIN